MADPTIIGLNKGKTPTTIRQQPRPNYPSGIDALGRSHTILPYTSTADMERPPSGSTNQAGFLSGTSNGVATIATANNAYSEVSFDNSPLNRIVRKAEPGADWKMTDAPTPDHTTRISYKLLAAPAPANLYLYGIENTDENGHITKTYTDLLNRPVVEINTEAKL